MASYPLVLLAFTLLASVNPFSPGLLPQPLPQLPRLADVLRRSFRYFRLLVNCIAYWRLRPIPLQHDPLYTALDATVVIPCLEGDGDELRETIRTVLRNDPYQIWLVTIDANLEKAQRTAASLSKKIKVESIPQANKRHQMCKAFPLIQTEITILADDDVLWPPTLLPYMLAPFEDSSMGGVGTNQRLRRKEQPNVWDFLGAAYLIRRNWDIAACTYMDGGLPCLSGRTVAYRTCILQDLDFQHDFTHETWRSYQLNADDDNFLTRWMVNHGWNTWIQYHEHCEVQTTLENNPKFLKQCLRWVRSNWRSNLKSLFTERTVWRRYPWSTYAVFQTTLTSWSFVTDPLMAWLFWQLSASWSWQVQFAARAICFLWIFLFCRIIKYLNHFARYPEDLKYVLLIPLFGYFHSSVIKLCGMCSLHVTTWGSREGADANDDYRMIRLPGYTSSGPACKTPRGSVEDIENECERTLFLPKYDDPV